MYIRHTHTVCLDGWSVNNTLCTYILSPSTKCMWAWLGLSDLTDAHNLLHSLDCCPMWHLKVQAVGLEEA